MPDPNVTSVQESLSLGGYRPESPFLNEDAYAIAPASLEGGSASFDEAEHGVIETPFLMEHADGVSFESPEAALYQELVADVFDDEFDNDVAELVGELAQTYELQVANEAPSVGGRLEAERQLERSLVPLREEAEAILERMAAGLGEVDLGAMPDEEVDRLLDGFAPSVEMESPAMEDFLGGLIKKAKKAVKKIAKKAKRVVGKVTKTVGKYLPHGFLLRRLRRLVKPLLKRVLRFAINKIPAQYRPLARKLSARFLKIAREASEETQDLTFLEEILQRGGAPLEDAEAASADTSVIQVELDSLIAGYAIEGVDFDTSPAVVGYIDESEADDGDPIGTLEAAREVFVREITVLDDGADVTPHVEQFVMAILPALKLGLKLIGRKRVVNFLAKLLAKQIQRFVGRQAARPLSAALIDAGLRTFSLESPEDGQHELDRLEAGQEEAASAVIAATIEETVEQLVAETPVDAFDDDQTLETYVAEAFESAAAANFPSALIQQGLRAGAGESGAWVLGPARGQKRFKHYTRPIDVVITPAMAKQIQSFDGQTIESFLGEQLNLPIEREPVKARLHLFEAVRGTRVQHIALHARGLAGLGSSLASATVAIHPLTCGAASLLIPKEVGLCRNVPDRFLRSRRHIAVRQRFYVLEIPGASMSARSRRTGGHGGVRPVRPSETNVTVDLRRRRIVIHQFMSERRAQEIAGKLRRGASGPALARLLRTSLASGLQVALSGRPTSHLKLVREVPLESELPGAIVAVLRMGGTDFSRALLRSLGYQVIVHLKSRLHAFSAEFQRASEHGADGTTLVMTMEAKPIFDLFRSSLFDLPRKLGRLARGNIITGLEIRVKPGFHR